jgi:hypothetical protein
MVRMRLGMVAVKRAVCLLAGSSAKMASSSSANPMSASSAFVEHDRFHVPESRVRRRMWSRARPGVATTTSTPRRRPPSCCVIDCPP